MSDGIAESVSAATMTIDVTPVNDPPGGSVVITGTPTENQTLNADASGITDVEGLGGFSYQWLRDGSEISGATTDSYLLGDDDVGAVISVRANYSDGQLTDEEVTSAGTPAIANINDLPGGAVVINGVPTEDQTLTADASTITDADGLGSFSYQWLRDGSEISGATTDSYLLGDDDVGTVISVRVNY